MIFIRHLKLSVALVRWLDEGRGKIYKQLLVFFVNFLLMMSTYFETISFSVHYIPGNTFKSVTKILGNDHLFLSFYLMYLFFALTYLSINHSNCRALVRKL